MSQRDVYPAGVPCWIESITADYEAQTRFYGDLLGWEFEVGGSEVGRYAVARLRGHDVAGIAPLPPGSADPPPVGWYTHVAVDDLAAAVQRASAAGGQVALADYDAAPAGRLGVVVDPGGAATCLWQAQQRQGAQLVNEPSAWAMSLLNTPDPAVAEAFYGQLFGWQAEPFGDGLWLWRLDGYVGGEPHQPAPRDVVAAMARSDGPAGWAVDLWVSDADRAAATAPELGGQVLQPPAEQAGFRRTVLADPQGAAFSASQLMI
jgi:hypothetical protein